jgi:hypothetical protein
MRQIPRSIYEEARDIARAFAKTEAFEQSCHDRERVEMLFARLRRVLKFGRLRLRAPRSTRRVHAGGDRSEFVHARKARCTTAARCHCARGINFRIESLLEFISLPGLLP